MASKDTIQAFFSYSRHDWKAAERSGSVSNILGHLFTQIELEVRAAEGRDHFCKWVDTEGLRWGDNWHVKIPDVIASCDLFFIFMSPGWLNSKICRQEFDSFMTLQNTSDDRRVFVAHVRDITKRQRTQHAKLLERLDRVQAKHWQSLLSDDEHARIVACATAGREVAEQLEKLSSAHFPSTSIPQSCDPTPLSERRRLVSGRLDIPAQGGVVDEAAMVMLYLSFKGLGEVETEKGSLVFGAKSATLVIYGEGTDITPHDEFNTDRRPSHITPIEYVDKDEIHYRIVARDGVLDGNVISFDEYSLPVVKARVPSVGKALVSGRVELHDGDLMIDEALSDLNDPAELESADARSLKSMRKALARMILEAHYKEFELPGCEI